MEKDLNSRTLRRHFEVDAAKTCAIVFMVIVHVYEYMSGIDYYHALPDSFLQNAIEFLGGPLVAPVFMVAMGIGMVMKRHDSPKAFMKRGVTLFAAGYALNFFRGTVPVLVMQAAGIDFEMTALETFLIVDILQFAGLSYLLAGFLKKCRIRPLWILCLALLMQAAGVFISSNTVHPDLPHMLLGLVLYTGRTTGFPLMLWFVYPATGMVFGEMLRKRADKNLFYKKTLAVSAAVLASMVSIMLCTGYDIRNVYVLTGDIYYRQDICHFLFTLPTVLIAFALLQLLFSGLEQTKPGKFITYSSINLNTIYIIQWMLVAYTFLFLLFIGIVPIGVAADIPTGLLLTAAAIGLSVIWKRVRTGCALKKGRHSSS